MVIVVDDNSRINLRQKPYQTANLAKVLQKSKAIQIGSEVAEIPFALREGHTIVGVMDTKNAMRFYIGNDVLDEQKYE